MRHLFHGAALLATMATAGPLLAQDQLAPVERSARGAGEHALRTAVAAPTRTPANVARDRYRNPAETLAFFGVEPGDTVVELWPGGGWYTEILAPYLAGGGGTLYVMPPAGRYADTIKTKLASNAAYANVRTAMFAPGATSGIQDGTVDVVLTFRNVHSWLGDKPIADDVFAKAFAMLKPGGTLGVVEHRLPANAEASREKDSGYLKVATVRGLAEKAGFQFAGASEINANPKDTADWPQGVWTLPPSYRLKDVDRAKYEAIGESDRMTLKFVKPGG